MQFDFNLKANGGQRIEVAGRFVKYKSGLGAIRIKLDKGGYVDLMPGQGIWGVDFSAILVNDRTGLANKGVLLAGMFDFRDDSIVGTVSIVDGGKNSTLQQNCFLGNVFSGQIAGNFNICMLANPANSARDVVVEEVEITPWNIDTVGMYMMGIDPVTSNHAQNKRAGIAGGAPSKAVIESSATTILGFGTPFWRSTMLSHVRVQIKYAEPLILPPGMALVVVNEVMAHPMNVNFEFREDLVAIIGPSGNETEAPPP